jgi:antitoxin HicB
MKMTDYTIKITPLDEEDGGGFLATIDEIPGCIADGATPDEVLIELGDAFRAWQMAQTEDGKQMPKRAPNAIKTAIYQPDIGLL